MATFLETWKHRARELKIETYAIYLAYRDPRVPLHARIFAACIVAYAVSPIDLIPDFIPVLGYLDDLILVPLGIVLALKMIPPDVMTECRVSARRVVRDEPLVNRSAAVVIVAIWLVVLGVVLALYVKFFR